MVLEAAGYDIVIVETVGVGQSEVAVAQMVDTFAFLALAGAGDQPNSAVFVNAAKLLWIIVDGMCYSGRPRRRWSSSRCLTMSRH